ncbi:hypothetical protein IVB22_28405 [Bradyrhizobium sp. 190]|uniref:hypothetical protein n=1 Tax=Bradyrhizobium sp. 190 TaxID=2782658 RepID=UPI001FFC1EED|nr:hypothetical protein [Bradyrhizobium sp. 190]MCK1516364.1 hypothetical protein [Bradyrhizobium sp. 190]
MTTFVRVQGWRQAADADDDAPGTDRGARTNREYLVQLAMQLDALGIQDPYVAQLYAEIGVTPDILTQPVERRHRAPLSNNV